ncbi:MAG: outer membrane beta-barrel protein [Chthoniobacterales bacterium]
MKKTNFSPLAGVALAAALLCLCPGRARAGGEGFSQDIMQDTSKENFDARSSTVDLGKFQAFPFHVTVSVRGGYDDNVNLTKFNTQDSFFTNLGLGLTYQFGSPRTQLNLSTGGSFTYYFDRNDTANGSSDNFDVNVYGAFAITHKVSPRLTLSANLYAAYQSQPDFQTFNNSTISFSRQSQNYFFTVNKFSLGYAWTPRFSTVSSYTLGYTRYDDDIVGRFEDRFEHTFGNEFRFLIAPTTTLVAEYRFGIVDYTETDGRDSTSNYFLAGIDHSFSPRFNLSARGGVEVRDYDNTGFLGTIGNPSSQTSPYGELTVNYALAQNTSISWSNRYSIEQSDVPELIGRTTYRTALSVRHNFTSRIVAGLNVAYQHDNYDGNFITSGFDEDSFDISLSARYAINRNWAIDLGYDHTEVISGQIFREYARNRYYGGLTFTF